MSKPQSAHQLAEELRTTRRELRRTTRALALSEAARVSAEQLAQQMITLLSVASHDLRTPLTAIIGYSDLLDMGIPDRIPDRTREPVRRIRRSARELLHQLNDMLGVISPIVPARE